MNKNQAEKCSQVGNDTVPAAITGDEQGPLASSVYSTLVYLFVKRRKSNGGVYKSDDVKCRADHGTTSPSYTSGLGREPLGSKRCDLTIRRRQIATSGTQKVPYMVSIRLLGSGIDGSSNSSFTPPYKSKPPSPNGGSWPIVVSSTAGV